MNEQILQSNTFDISVPSDKVSKNALRHKIYFSINGEGYGHSSRALAIAR